MNPDQIGALLIPVGLFLVCAPFVWAQRRDEAARRDRLRERATRGRYPSMTIQRIEVFPEYADAIDLANEGRRSVLLPTVVDMAELAAFTSTADLPADMRSA